MIVTNPPGDLHEAKMREVQNAQLAQQQRLLMSIAGEPSDVATRNILEGELVMGKDCLYIATRNIPREAKLVEGMNVSKTMLNVVVEDIAKE